MNKTVHDAQAIFSASLQSVRADRLLAKVNWKRIGRRRLDQYRRIIVAGIGKASAVMAGVVEGYLGQQIREGVVVVPQGYLDTLPSKYAVPKRISILEGGHPIPDDGSLKAAASILQLATSCERGDLFILLLSGGGSALCTSFVEGITLEDAKATFRLLLESGADIYAVNTVRKHLSRIKGGHLARQVYPGEVVTLVISDVAGDDLSVIASGPTVPDPTTFADAIEVLRSYKIWKSSPESVRAHLIRGASDSRLETPKADDPLFRTARTTIIGNNRDAVEGAAAEAGRRGYVTNVFSEIVTGEAREVGPRLASEALGCQVSRPTCLVWGGETTVTVKGQGKGGRNQELALAAALALEGTSSKIVFLSGGTDGIDGPTDAAGAWVTQETVLAAVSKGIDPAAFLENNDAYIFFDRIEQLLKPGPTHTNVMDVQIALIIPG